MILAPLVGIILNLMDASADSGNQELNDVVAVFANMDCPATVHFGFQYLLSYDWVRFLEFHVLDFLFLFDFELWTC